jgi:hypothetical protein
MKNDNHDKSARRRIAWHPAFFEAIQLELDQYRDVLDFSSEYQLTSEPLKIDVVIIKKLRDVAITKNIAAIFRTVNIIEYKSPSDHVSVDDFYKVYGYACLYASFEKRPITDLSLSFVESRYPKDLLAHLTKTRGYTVEKRGSGVYDVKGDIMPIQIIGNRRLSAEENLWLNGLDENLDVEAIDRVTAAIQKLGRTRRSGAYLDVVSQANPENLKEDIYMRKRRDRITLEDVFEEVGWTAKWEARGVERNARSVAQKLIDKGWSPGEVAELVELDIETVRSLAQAEP